MKYWFYLESQATGPFDKEQIRALIQKQKIDSATLAWCDAMSEWQAARYVPQLQPLFTNQRRRIRPKAIPAKYSFFIRRMIAGTIDFLFLGGLLAILYLAANNFGFLDFVERRQFEVMTGLVTAYFLCFMSRPGQGRTIGCHVTRLQLVDSQTLQRVPFHKLVLWYVISFLLFASLLWYVAWAWYFIDSKNRMIHNILSGTAMRDLKN